jgi:hypothetical protein
MAKPANPRQAGSFIREKDGTLRRQSPEEQAARAARNRKTFPEAVDQLLGEERFSASAVIDRMKEAMGVESDADLAWWFGTSPQSLWNKKSRNSVPYREAIFIANWTRSSLKYILTGEGDLDDAT